MARLLDITPASKGLKLPLWLWDNYFRPRLWFIIAAFVLMAVEGSMLGLISYMVGPMFDRVFVAKNAAAIYAVGGLMFVVFLARALSGFGQRVLMSVIGQKAIADMQADLVRHMMRLDSLFFQDNAPGALIERVRGDTQAIQVAWSAVFTSLGRDIISLVALLGVAISIDWVWTLVAVAGVPLLIVPVFLLQKMIHATTRHARQMAALISTRLDEIFHGINPIKLNNLENQQDRRFTETLKSYVRAQIRSEAGQAGVPAMMDIVAGLGFMGVLVYGGFQIIDGTKTIGQFMSFFTSMALIFEPLRRLGNISGLWQAAVASIERLHAIFDQQPGITSPPAPVAITSDTGRKDIELRDICFAYGDNPVLDHLTLTAQAGKTTALVGASGAGKSTLFNVLTRLVEPQSGLATIGGIDIRDMALGDLRGLFSVVTQDAALFDETLRDNIMLSRPDASEEEFRRAADAAFVTDFVQHLPQGFDTPAGPRGSNLSGGQRQRVAIARAVLRDAPILLLDEPTSALDAQSEAAVQKALDALSKGRTTLVIAHRLATILHADKIVVMDKGRVVDEGTHEELLAHDGLYASLYRLQFEG
ncbi:MAG: ABC transporter ATP-binding protein [Paracoccaceae bacterium]|nr:ABC transporter ATP-binding protein [Paracoccaceae bacterium]